jgi:hypothetical protein
MSSVLPFQIVDMYQLVDMLDRVVSNYSVYLYIYRYIYLELALCFSGMHDIHRGCEQVLDVSLVHTLC